ncbi:hypothetical protein E2562_007050 [Oryza meyeriana var. granulata]|uniref:WRKY domain-containing protein n=1 Tax=Oryza meyeriana var. granulata TaxID=110450 RepID=A0A6G1E9U2_9ORYZ|nr:hypothetical protein E2562_007050 [Oryza meyeriana var. granulata]
MCDYFLQRMEGEQAGDLADIVRAGGAAAAGGGGGSGSCGVPSTASTEWQLPPAEETGLFPLPPPSSSDGSGMSGADAFGDPFAGLPDPFVGDYPSFSSGVADFFDAVVTGAVAKAGFVDVGVVGGGCDGGGGGGVDGGGGLLGMRKPILPRGMHQMPSVSPRAIRPYPVMAGDKVKLGAPMAGGPCAFDAAAAGLHMSSSPRAGGGIKRRKNQARKVVCIPAPAAAGGRTSGEVVPSDLWAWRKYGQKPIKGSPYPRGYYRCSSSKGCSARKQVERSRTDPNMLVITYTSEHNHPWPTQRNALAGSTRSHHAKNSSCSSSSSASNKNNSSSSYHQKPSVKAEPNDQATAAAAATTTTTMETTGAAGNSTAPSTVPVKEETMVGSSETLVKQKSMEDAASAAAAVEHSDLMQQMFYQSYRPMIPEAGGHHDDFFADLAELESDPMSLIFSKEYMATKPGGDPDKEMNVIGKDLDPAYMLDWSTTVVTTADGSSFMQGEGGL